MRDLQWIIADNRRAAEEYQRLKKLPTKIEVGHLAHGSQFRRWPRGLIWTVDRHQEDYTFATPVTAAGRPGQQRMLPSYTVVYCFDSFRWQDARTTGTYLFLEDRDE